MTTKEQATARIQKLLALANRPGTPAEGEAALSRARALATKHGLRIEKRKPAPATDTGWFHGLSDYLRNVDRTEAERAAREFKRQRTRTRNVRRQGEEAFGDGIPLARNPYKQGMTFGVDQRREWAIGWLKARDKEGTT